MSGYLDTLDILQEEHANVRKMIHLRASEPDGKINLMRLMGARKAYELCQQYFSFSDRELQDHVKMIDSEVNELLMLIDPEELGFGNLLKSLE